MARKRTERTVRWGAKWVSVNRRDGRSEHFLREDLEVMLFKTRAAARGAIEQRWGYIKSRKDLREEPHGWQLPKAVRVEVIYREMASHGQGFRGSSNRSTERTEGSTRV